MKNNPDGRTPTLEDCINKYQAKKTLLDTIEELEQEHIRLECRVKTLRIAEEALRQDVIRLSDTLSRLYDMAGKLVNSNNN